MRVISSIPGSFCEARKGPRLSSSAAGVQKEVKYLWFLMRNLQGSYTRGGSWAMLLQDQEHDPSIHTVVLFRSKGDSGEELQEQRKRRDGDHWLRKRSGRAGISWWVYCTSFVSRNMRKLESFLVPHSTICGYLSWWVLYYTSFPSKGESALSVKSSKRNGDHWGRTVILKKSFTNRWTWWVWYYTSLCLENIRKL